MSAFDLKEGPGMRIIVKAGERLVGTQGTKQIGSEEVRGGRRKFYQERQPNSDISPPRP